MGDHAATTTAHADALDRAWRTFKQGIAVDALAGAGAGILALADTVDVTTTAFWTAAGALILKSFIVSAASYAHRLKSEPASVRQA